MLEILLAFLKIGFLGFGGGYAMLSLIFAESERFGLTLQQFADLNALDGLIPGPIAINSATYIGQIYGGLGTALVATLAVSVPSLIFVPLYLHFESKIKGRWQLNAILNGIKPASVGLILAVAASLALAMIAPTGWQLQRLDWLSLSVMGLVLLLDLRWHINPLVLLLIAGAIGGISYYF